MCGIFGFFDNKYEVHASTLRKCLDSLSHRGPDASGVWQENGTFIGHRRLSIIDLETGGQPMTSADGRFILSYNGEIYNFQELRKCLIEEGVEFSTRSDSEVVLQGYIRWGERVLNRLNGMFAFLIWDRQLRRLFAARDRLGIKPLCWSLNGSRLIVSSTLEPFRWLDTADYDFTALRDLMAFDYVPAPKTILSGVRKLEPGCYLSWKEGAKEPSICRYWEPPLPDPESAVPSEEELEQLLEQSVQRQMISDVPLGVFLSGGIDSSLLVAMMARHSSRPVRTFSVSFAVEGFDESAIAREVAQRFATNHTVLEAEQISDEALLALIGRLDEPFCDPTVVPTYALAQRTRQHVKVALSGDGGDEVFGGYRKYLRLEERSRRLPFAAFLQFWISQMTWRPRGMAHLYKQTLSAEDRIRYTWARYGDFPVFRKDVRQLFSKDYHDLLQVDDYFAPWERVKARYGEDLTMDSLMRVDLQTYLSENCLVKTDRASMLASLEVRVPFLDEFLLDRILPLPAESKIQNGKLKALLLPIARRLLPEGVWNRPKQGFNVPLDQQLRGPWRKAVETALEWGEENIPIFNYQYLRKLHAINLSEGGISRELWNPFVFLAWVMAGSKDSLT
ncbi:MAG TPA: asparagine synthase (glutamine-hydrolyzing) [Acidobacteriota bacterium]|nr:asparagine synthase (glutamine-hydrolyzing) [Acidobacteriota bacterium]